MRRKQIYLDEDSEQRLKTLALRRRRSEAALIREAVSRYLSQEEPRPADTDEGSPLLQMVGLIKRGRTDSAARHDHYLYHEDK